MIQEYEKTESQVQNAFFSSKEREQMIAKYAYLVKYLAGRVASRIPSSVVFDELISAGSLGLIDAVDKYDPKKNVGLKTYAQYRIKGAILDELRSMDWYSRSMRKKIQSIEKAVHSVEARERRPASDMEIAEEMDQPLENYFKMLSDIHGAALLSLDDFIKNNDGSDQSSSTFTDGMRSDDNPSETLIQSELKDILANAIRKLTDKEQMVISLYYYDELTLKEIGNVMELTESRICQIHTMALIKLKSKIKEYKNT
ncbi:MAG: FliA/WhiG family RNA polymerase sigma factor [Proteobacteria bacterium]|nr:FliA/WhiG family RNA polymerase sigma factor [Pseudomonadota bacterium]